MRTYYDLNLDQFVTQPGYPQPISHIDQKRSSSGRLEVQFVRAKIVQELSTGAAGILGMKIEGQYDADYSVYASSWTKTGTGTSTVYAFSFSFINSALNNLFRIDGNSANDVPFLPLMAELQWTDDDGLHKSPTLFVTLANDINRGGEAIPVTFPLALSDPYFPSITSLTGGTASDLDAIPTLGAEARQLYTVVVDDRGLSTWMLVADTGSPITDTEAGVIVTTDHDDTTNPYHLIRVSGY